MLQLMGSQRAGNDWVTEQDSQVGEVQGRRAWYHYSA